MKILIDEELTQLLNEIQNENKTQEEWAEIESSDMFQSDSYCGGYDADEDAFCFSFFKQDEEFWFQFSLDEVQQALSGNLKVFDGIKADT